MIPHYILWSPYKTCATTQYLPGWTKTPLFYILFVYTSISSCDLDISS